MFFWFLGTAVVAVCLVFRDPRFDYRLLLVGAVLPEIDAFFGGARLLHTLLFSVALLTLVMVATTGRRPSRRALLSLPIGTFLHLVFDGVWADTAVFWWPAFGFGFEDAPLPAAERGWWNVPLEIAGLVLLVWVWRAADVSDAVRRRDFLRHGRLDVASA